MGQFLLLDGQRRSIRYGVVAVPQDILSGVLVVHLVFRNFGRGGLISLLIKRLIILSILFSIFL